jgi:hypothetical protein
MHRGLETLDEWSRRYCSERPAGGAMALIPDGERGGGAGASDEVQWGRELNANG